MLQAGIHTKFILILAMAALAPITIGVVSIRILGIRHYEEGQGQLYQTIAEYLSDELTMLVRHQADRMRGWAQKFELADSIGGWNGASETAGRAGRADRAPATAEGDADFAQSDVGKQLHQFRAYHPEFAGLAAADRHGRIIAGVGASRTNGEEAEAGRQVAQELDPWTVRASGLHFHPPTGDFLIALSMPIYGGESGGGEPVGTVTGMIKVLPLFRSLQAARAPNQPSMLVALKDGRILARLHDRPVVPMQESLPPNVADALFSDAAGWRVARLGTAAEQHLFGYAKMQFGSDEARLRLQSEVEPMYVVVHQDRAVVNAPITLQAMLLYASGATLVVVFMLTGLYIAERKIVAPLRLLQRAAQAISSTAGVGESAQTSLRKPPGPERRETAETMAAEVRTIRTGDELEALARDFGWMANRVLRYHDELETEIALRLEDIANDQQVAREFQQALLPRSYPDIPEPGLPAVFRLRFDHVYEPTLAVGGDFFQVAKRSPRQARVFIADVMGHGARSALVTAILRTHLEELAPDAQDPADLLGRINAKFCASLPRQDERIFATACALILDTEAGTLQYAVAGHPPPILLNGAERRAEFLPPPSGPRAAIGLFDFAEYGCRVCRFRPGDGLLLYTDGLVEALGPSGEEFGADRLLSVVHGLVGRSARELTSTVMTALRQHTQAGLEMDDVCVIAIEACSAVIQPTASLTREPSG